MDKDLRRKRFIDITSKVPTTIIIIDIHFAIFAVFANHRDRALPNLIIRQEYVEIFYIRRIALDIGLGRIFKTRLNPKFVFYAKIFASKAGCFLKLDILANLSPSDTTRLTIVTPSSGDVEKIRVIGTTNFGRRNFIPTGVLSTLCKAVKVATASCKSGSPAIRKFKINGALTPFKSCRRILHTGKEHNTAQYP